ncbi:MAG: helix-turn-helix domain-containing protein [Candidatus Obscuribacterales bacterium]|jgi:DNA-binding transcriptional MerR regulator|nr:helix-turn-helix domain-containing protein [Candidatus Obscuribacterales bacterium]
MRQKNKGEGTKIAQAAKELGVTSVTIRRYLTEFNIETTADENGIKVLPKQAMDELALIRKHKEDGLTNPKVLEILEESRAKGGSSEKAKPAAKEKEKEKEKEKPEPARKAMRRAPAEPTPVSKAKKTVSKKAAAVVEEEEEEEEEEDTEAEEEEEGEEESEDEEDEDAEAKKADAARKDEGPVAIPTADGKSKYSLTCQTCNKVFEHMNPRLRDCLDCYRIKRKERRRGGDKHKNVIQNPLAQQVLSKNQQAQQAAQMQAAAPEMEAPTPVVMARAPIEQQPRKISVREQLNFAPVGTTPSVYQRPTQVRNYRKAIEETRQITSNLKRRLERPDLPEAERRFLEQIYAYQLILHQGWKHLSEYKQGDSPRHEN